MVADSGCNSGAVAQIKAKSGRKGHGHGEMMAETGKHDGQTTRARHEFS
jgi:hypothetical protein